MKRRAIFVVAGVLVLMAGLLAAFGVTGSSSAQSPPPRTSVPMSGKVLIYVWVTDPARPRPSRSIGLNFWEGKAWRGWFTIHANRWRKIWLRPGIKICAVKKPFRITPRCQFVSSHGQQIVFTLAVATKGPVVPPRTPPVPPTPPTPPPPPTVPTLVPVWVLPTCVGGTGPVTLAVTASGPTHFLVLQCGVTTQIALVPPGTTMTICVAGPVGSTVVAWSAGVVQVNNACVRFRPGQVGVTISITIVIPVVVVTTTTPPPTTTTVVTVTTTTTTPTTTSGRPVDPNP